MQVQNNNFVLFCNANDNKIVQTGFNPCHAE